VKWIYAVHKLNLTFANSVDMLDYQLNQLAKDGWEPVMYAPTGDWIFRRTAVDAANRDLIHAQEKQIADLQKKLKDLEPPQ
jgi:hypothetical protein